MNFDRQNKEKWEEKMLILVGRIILILHMLQHFHLLDQGLVNLGCDNNKIRCRFNSYN